MTVSASGLVVVTAVVVVVTAVVVVVGRGRSTDHTVVTNRVLG
jgi:hypothetical protein